MRPLAAFLACTCALAGVGAVEHQQLRASLIARDVVSYFSITDATSAGTPATSASMHCVVSLVIQFLAIYLALGLSRTYAYAKVRRWEDVSTHQVLQSCGSTMNHAPMLAALFIAYRLHVLFLTHGRADLDDPWGARNCMYMSTYTLAGAVFCMIASAFCASDLAQRKAGKKAMLYAVLLYYTKFAMLFFCYAGAAGVVFGMVWYYQPPPGTWPGDAVPGMSASSKCVCALTCQFFFVYLVNEVLLGTKWAPAMKSATDAINCAPMLAVLFLALRMRSWQTEGEVAVRPHEWAQMTFFVCTFCLPVQTLLAFLAPYLMPSVEVERMEEATQQERNSNRLGVALIVARFAIIAWLYAGLGYITYLDFHAEKGSVSQQCVIILAWHFLAVYLGVTAFQAVKEVQGVQSTILAQTIEQVKATAGLSPMLSLLIMAVRMRVLAMTEAQGNVIQASTLEAMYACIWVLDLLTVFNVLLVFTTKLPRNKDARERVREVGQAKNFYIMEAVKYLWLVILYNGVGVIMLVSFVLPPEGMSR